MLHVTTFVASVCTPCCMHVDVCCCLLVASCRAKFETGQSFEPTTPNISFVPWSPRRSATMLNPFARGSFDIREFYIRVYSEPLTAGGHVTSLSRHVRGLRRAFSTWGGKFSRMSFSWKFLAYNSCFIPRNDTKILWSKSLSINRGTNSGEMLNLINPIGSRIQVPFMAADSKWRP